MKPEELRQLEAEELTQRLKDSRRELFELRFKLAVGQLENHRQILKVRKDIARILTVMHEHRLGMSAGLEGPPPGTGGGEVGGSAAGSSTTAVAEAPPAEEETEETTEEKS